MGHLDVLNKASQSQLVATMAGKYKAEQLYRRDVQNSKIIL